MGTTLHGLLGHIVTSIHLVEGRIEPDYVIIQNQNTMESVMETQLKLDIATWNQNLVCMN